MTTSLQAQNLNPNFADMGTTSALGRIRISSDDPLAFAFSDARPMPREFVANITGGTPRYSAKSPAGEWRNFSTKDEFDAFVEENAGWDAVQKYQLRLSLPEDQTPYAFDLPVTSAIAFFQYREALIKEGLGVAQVITKFSVERVNRKNSTDKFSRVKFDSAGPLVEAENAAEAADARVAGGIGKHWSQVDSELQTFWKTMRAMGIKPEQVMKSLGVEDLLHYPDDANAAVKQITEALF